MIADGTARPMPPTESQPQIADRGRAARRGAAARAALARGWLRRRVLVVAGGFLLVPGPCRAERDRARRKADGIVVLTGGASRIEDAIELLAPGAASGC